MKETMHSPLAIAKAERERERETLCPNHAIVWPLIVDIPPAGRASRMTETVVKPRRRGERRLAWAKRDRGKKDWGGGLLSPDFRAGPGRLPAKG